MASYATLCLGTRPDAGNWNAGCDLLGMTCAKSVYKSNPSMADVESIFTSGAQWVYLGGHFNQDKLYNHDGSTYVKFFDDRIEIRAGGASKTIERGSAGFNLNETATLVLWGGCSVFTGTATLKKMRTLFAAHVALGFYGLTGMSIVQAMLGGGFIKKPKDFFSRLQASGGADYDAAVGAWMETAAYGYGGGAIEEKFRAMDYLGQTYKLKGKTIQKDVQI